MNASQLPLLNAPHANQGLFSDYYLDKIIPAQDDWLNLSNDARPVWDLLRARFATLNPEQLDESQLEEQWVKFVLNTLGWQYSVQVKIRFGATGYRKPDYALTASPDTARTLTNQIYSPAALRDAGVLAVADAKKWDVPFDQAPRGERNPSQQIDEYLRYSELRWGILTDGRIWRLYERDSSKNNVYFAVDLKALLENDDSTNFLYFFAFFRQAAFESNGWLDRTLAGSTDFAQSLSDTLEDQVYDALELIAQGFLDYRRNRLKPTPETLRELYEQSLVLLYRLLFILYAESRDILPISDNKNYRDTRSLHTIKAAIALPGGIGLDVDGGDLYHRLLDLFFAIDQGNSRYGLPAYNGGLFSMIDHPFLEKYFIDNWHLAAAIDKMARVPDRDKPGVLLMVDYRDLDVRHLGAIYEKLLEYVLDIATVPLADRDGTYVPAQPGDSVAKAAGIVYLRTGNHQRKVTGSYYTPDYIVRFIVERTLEPLLTAITGRYASRDVEGRWIVREADALREAILALNVLDPAAGSGHFMVDAMAYIAEWLRGLALAPADLPRGEDELLYWKRQVVLACIYGVDLNPLAVELAKLSLWLATLSRGKPLSFLDHHIQCGNSLIGARAHEIGLSEEVRARRATATRNAVQAQEAGQITFYDDSSFAPTLSFAIDQMSAIEHSRADTIDQVKQQEMLYAALTDRLTEWRRTADVWTARHFGIPFDNRMWGLINRALMHNADLTLKGMDLGTKDDVAALTDIIARAEAIARSQHFFHWELVFPEVFFAPDGTPKTEPGFDAIVGNPPYVRQEYIQPIKEFLAARYPDIFSGMADLYVYFYGRGLDLLRPGGVLGYVTANKWFRSGYGEGLRGYLAERATVHEIVDFGNAPIFRGAETFPAVVLIGKPMAAASHAEQAARVTIFPRELLHIADLGEYADTHHHRVPTARFSQTPWSLETGDDEILMTKIREAGIPLSEFTGGIAYRGLLSGFNEAFFIDTPTKERLVSEDPQCAAMIKPLLRGENIERWSPDWEGQWIILIKSSENQAQVWSQSGEQAENVFAKAYPSIYGYFKPLEARLRRRQDQGRFWWELRSCAYYQKFDQSKLIYQVIQSYSAYSLDTNGYITNDKCYFVSGNDLYLLSVLNSPVMWWYGHRYFGHMLNDALNPSAEKMVSLPIAPPADAIRAEVETEAQRLIDLSKMRREQIHELLAWLRAEVGIETPGQKLEGFASLTESEFIEAVKARRPRRHMFTPASLRRLTDNFRDYSAQIGGIDTEAAHLERGVSDRVNTAYGLTAADIDLLWRTAPPRMPVTRERA